MDTPKLRLYCNLNTELRMEDYLTDITDFQCRRAFTRIRVGTHELRIETGRYRKPKEDIKDRICCVCCKGLVEDEQHLLLDCISYESLRRRMMRSIRWQTGGWYNLAFMREDRDWMMDTLIGHSVVDARHRKVMRVATSRFLYKALKLRAKYLGQDSK